MEKEVEDEFRMGDQITQDPPGDSKGFSFTLSEMESLARLGAECQNLKFKRITLAAVLKRESAESRVNQRRDDGGPDQGISNGGSEIQLDSGYTWKVESADRMDTEIKETSRRIPLF